MSSSYVLLGTAEKGVGTPISRRCREENLVTGFAAQAEGQRCPPTSFFCRIVNNLQAPHTPRYDDDERSNEEDDDQRDGPVGTRVVAVGPEDEYDEEGEQRQKLTKG